jgi:hypothetical protein
VAGAAALPEPGPDPFVRLDGPRERDGDQDDAETVPG